MKNIINVQITIFVLLILGVTSCNAQQTYPLNKSAYSTPTNGYFKDLNNELTPYVGTWKAAFQGKAITLHITKETKRPYEAWGKNFFKDVLIAKYEVKDSAGNILESTLNNTYAVGSPVKNMIISATINLNSNNEVNLAYSGGNCSVGIGVITFKKINNTQFYWSYVPGTSTRDDIACPPNLDYNIYLPETENLVFTKQ